MINDHINWVNSLMKKTSSNLNSICMVPFHCTISENDDKTRVSLMTIDGFMMNDSL